MNLDVLLALLGAFDREDIDYAVAGDLASLMRGHDGLTERLEIAVSPDDAEHARSVIEQAWPDSQIVDCQDALMRLLPANTPFYVDVTPRSGANVEVLYLRRAIVRVESDPDATVAPALWSRQGFTLRERLTALHALTRELLPPHAITGVRTYRTIEQADADRERWDRQRADRLRTERSTPPMG